MNAGERRSLLSSVCVEWSSAEQAFVAESPRFPGLTYRDPHSSLAAAAGLLDLVEDAEPSGTRPPGQPVTFLR